MERNQIPGAVASLCCGDSVIGKALAADPRIKLLSFTGSCAVGNQVLIKKMIKYDVTSYKNFHLGGR